ncbi:uncharacterized protein [Miscanthus floridulus]|uniref:uncharacterized protein isoform X2 n=1 Tax=Miscanthus floridulus TaxID=154761 RepID=UPI003458CD38
MLVARRGDGFRCLLDDGIKADATERKQRKRPCTAPQPFLKVTSASSCSSIARAPTIQQLGATCLVISGAIGTVVSNPTDNIVSSPYNKKPENIIHSGRMLLQRSGRSPNNISSAVLIEKHRPRTEWELSALGTPYIKSKAVLKNNGVPQPALLTSHHLPQVGRQGARAATPSLMISRTRELCGDDRHFQMLMQIVMGK